MQPPTTTHTDATVFDDEGQAEAVRAQVAREVAELYDDPDRLTEAARAYFRLRSVIYLHMGNMSPWVQPGATIDEYRRREYPVDTTGAEVAELELFIAHLAGASHGACDYCARTIYATDPYVHVHRRRWWHPAVWGRAALDALRTIVNAGDYQYAHPECAGADACHTRHGQEHTA